MRIRFFLKRPDAVNPTSIYALISYEGFKVKLYTGENIEPKFWNQKSQSARVSPKFPESPEFNHRLGLLKSGIHRVFTDYRNKNNNSFPTPQQLKVDLEAFINGSSDSASFIQYFETFIRNTQLGLRINPKTKLPIKESGIRGYSTTLQHINEFAKTWKRKVDFDSIDLEFHQDFCKYLSNTKNKLSANTIGSHIQRIKAVMAEATEKGLNTNMAFKSKYFVKQSEETEAVYLSETELKELAELDLSASPRLDNVRDLFLIGCYTGLRFSDFSSITPQNISDGLIRVNQVKTGRPVVIPVHGVVKAILEKRGGEFPRGISNEKMNNYLKEIGKLMDSMKKTETKTITKGGVKVISNIEKWSLLTTHTARRSFATNEYKAGTPSITIMAITGHKTEKSFLKYIRVNQEEHADIIANLWAERERKAKLKIV